MSLRTTDEALRQLARAVLAERAGAAADAQDVAAAARRAYDDLARVSAPLIGDAGVDALTGRAVHLAQREYRWLTHKRDVDRPDGQFAQVVACLARQDPAVAAEGAGAVFATLIGLLATFIGDSLTAQLMRKAWPDAFSDATTQET